MMSEPYWLCCGSKDRTKHDSHCIEAKMGHPERCRFGTAAAHSLWEHGSMGGKITEEEFCHEQINRIRQQYQDAIQPWLDRLVRIESMKPMRPIVFDTADLPESVKEWIKSQI